MTVKELRELLVGVPDDMEVLIPMDATGFDGMFLRPCTEESGVAELGDSEEDLDKDEVEKLIHPASTEKSFVIAPCGFFGICMDEDEEEEPDPQLN